MSKLPRLSGKEIIKALSKIGFKSVRQKGSHVIMVKMMGDDKRGLVVPLHKEIDRGTLVDIIRQAGLKRDEFLKLL